MSVLVISALLFSAGMYGVLTRRDLVAVIASVEVMIGGALVMLVGLGTRVGSSANVEAIALMVLVLAAAEAAVGLALVVSVARSHRGARADELTEVRG